MMEPVWRGCLVFFAALSVAACGVGLPEAPVLAMSFGLKQLGFSWTAVSDADTYRVLEDPDGTSGFGVVAANLTSTSFVLDIAVHRLDWTAARYRVEACNSALCNPSSEVAVLGGMLAAIGYFKAPKRHAADNFGNSVALSADGGTLAVGAIGESSNATGINGDGSDNSAAGAVYVFTRSGGVWSLQAYVKASNTDAGDLFGYSVALSGDGDTLAVGAIGEDSNATGINGDGSDDSASDAGAVYVFTRSGGVWSQQAYVKASNTDAGDLFGYSVALSGDGDTLAAGAYLEASNASGINRDQENDTATDAGAVCVFTRSGAAWSQQAYVKASNTNALDQFGRSVALSGAGGTLAVGAPFEDSSATGIDGKESDNTASAAGAVYVFTRSGRVWSQQAYVKASNTNAETWFGWSVALGDDGDTLAVGAPREGSNATGENGDAGDDTTTDAGAVHVFTRSVRGWSQQAYVNGSNTGAGDVFGWSVALSGDGNTLAVGAHLEDSNATGVNGDGLDDSAANAGAAYVFIHSGGVWSQQAYVKASNTGAGHEFGWSVALSGDGDTLAVGAASEDSNATGVGGDESDDSAANAGAVYLY